MNYPDKQATQFEIALLDCIEAALEANDGCCLDNDTEVYKVRDAVYAEVMELLEDELEILAYTVSNKIKGVLR